MDSRPKWQILTDLFYIILFPILSALFTCIVCGIILIIYEKITGREMSRTVVIPLIIIFFMIILICLFIHLRKNSNRFYVSVDDENIYFGRKKETKLPFDEILAIINGLPEKMNSTMSANKYLNYGLWLNMVATRKSSLLIVNKDFSIIQFYIHDNTNGTELMEAFIKKNSSKFILDHEYDNEQIDVLKNPRWNNILKSPRIKNAFCNITL